MQFGLEGREGKDMPSFCPLVLSECCPAFTFSTFTFFFFDHLPTLYATFSLISLGQSRHYRMKIRKAIFELLFTVGHFFFDSLSQIE